MSGFTKLVPEIVNSSLWNEAAEIRCVWIAMIATKDESGYVRGDARTIARVANVSLESTTAALAMFQEPDPSSHTPDNEGRRIMPAPGGWIVLNHEIYRARDDVYRAKTRDRVKRFRDKMEQPKEDVTLQETLLERYHSASASVSASESVNRGSQEGGEIHKPIDAKEAKTITGAVKAIKRHPAFTGVKDVNLENLFKEYDFCREHWPIIIRRFMTDFGTVESRKEMKYEPVRQLRWEIDRYCKDKKIGQFNQ